MLTVDSVMELAPMIGRRIGPGPWVRVTQQMIDAFAAVSGDHQWIHTDPARCRRELGTDTIAHGFLILSLIPVMAREVLLIRNRRQSLNYGTDRIRYLAPVPCGSRLRLWQKPLEARQDAKGIRLVIENEVELEGSSRPALLAQIIQVIREGDGRP